MYILGSNLGYRDLRYQIIVLIYWAQETQRPTRTKWKFYTDYSGLGEKILYWRDNLRESWQKINNSIQAGWCDLKMSVVKRLTKSIHHEWDSSNRAMFSIYRIPLFWKLPILLANSIKFSKIHSSSGERWPARDHTCCLALPKAEMEHGFSKFLYFSVFLIDSNEMWNIIPEVGKLAHEHLLCLPGVPKNSC